jgi:hypothetical protein
MQDPFDISKLALVKIDLLQIDKPNVANFCEKSLPKLSKKYLKATVLGSFYERKNVRPL